MTTLYQLPTWTPFARTEKLYPYEELIKAINNDNYNIEKDKLFYDLNPIRKYSHVKSITKIIKYYEDNHYLIYIRLNDGAVEETISWSEYLNILADSKAWLEKANKIMSENQLYNEIHYSVLGKAANFTAVEKISVNKSLYSKNYQKSHNSIKYGRNTKTGRSSIHTANLFNQYNKTQLPIRHRNRHLDDTGYCWDDNKRIEGPFSTGWKHSTKNKFQYEHNIKRRSNNRSSF